PPAQPLARLLRPDGPLPTRPRPVGLAEELGRAAVSVDWLRRALGWIHPAKARMMAAMAAPFAILGIDHVVLRAADPAALERFYVEALGCTLELRQGKLTQLRAGRTLIDIVPADEAGAARRASPRGGA